MTTNPKKVRLAGWSGHPSIVSTLHQPANTHQAIDFLKSGASKKPDDFGASKKLDLSKPRISSCN